MDGPLESKSNFWHVFEVVSTVIRPKHI